jgi:hypothetical protein
VFWQPLIRLHVPPGTNPAEARVRCKLVPLKAKAEGDQVIYVFNADNEKVLQTLTFRGDLAQHVF